MSRPVEGRRRGVLHVVLWIVQALLFVMYASSGFMKMTMPIDSLVKYVPWSPDVPLPLVRFIGVCEFAGAIGLILPAAARIVPILTPVAALCLTVVMILGSGFHVMRGEANRLPMVLSFGALAAFVAWGRFVKAPIAPRRRRSVV